LVTGTHLIICEGKDDQVFFNSFIQNRALANLQVLRHADGITGFKNKLMAIEQQVTLKTHAILLVCDNDSNPKRNFDKVRKQISQITNNGTPLYNVPTGRFQPAKMNGRPTIGIFSLPGVNGTKRGTIETLLLEVFMSEPQYIPIKTCLNRFMACSGAKQALSISKQAKMRLRCFISATCTDSPECKVSELWQSKRNFRHLLGNNQLDYIEIFLRKFSNW
jgi:hypothetical protein